MKVAVVGSRNLRVDDLGKYLPDGVTEIVSGGARGVDTSAREYERPIERNGRTAPPGIPCGDPCGACPHGRLPSPACRNTRNRPWRGRYGQPSDEVGQRQRAERGLRRGHCEKAGFRQHHLFQAGFQRKNLLGRRVVTAITYTRPASKDCVVYTQN